MSIFLFPFQLNLKEKDREVMWAPGGTIIPFAKNYVFLIKRFLKNY